MEPFMRAGLSIGATGELRQRVRVPVHTIALGDGAAVVFSTPSMINQMEHAARAALRPFLEVNEESVGVDVNVTHLAATPVGAFVHATARVTSIDGKVVSFEVEARDDHDVIGRGTHRRAVIDVNKFASRLQAKSGTGSSMNVHPPKIVPNTGSMPAFTRLVASIEKKCLTVTLNRPDKLNCIDPAMSGELRLLVEWLVGHEQDVRVVVITGAGKGFCAGDDLKQMTRHTPDEAERWNVSEAELFLAMQQLPQVLVAMINGACFGGGMIVALACDLRVASRAAQFGMPEVNLGWPPSFGIPLLASSVGKARAAELCLRGHTIDAAEAERIGLVHEVTPPMTLERTVAKRVEELLSKPATALRETRRLMHAVLPDVSAETETATNASYLRSLSHGDAKEGLSSFLEKRPARFKGP
jgi:enoyl-CoA hydratase